MNNRVRSHLLALLCALLMLILGWYWAFMYQQLLTQQKQALLSDLVSVQSHALERRLDATLVATRMLAMQIRLNSGEIGPFASYASAILAAVDGVNNIQLAPDGIIRHIYPPEGNEAAIGHNILQDDRRRDEARKAVITRQMTLAGPFELIQGGVAVIGRQPVFTRLRQSDKENFWGFASALIYLDELIQATDLNDLEKKGYSFQLSRWDVAQQKELPFYQSGSELGSLSRQGKIKVPNGYWLLTVSTRPETMLSAGNVIRVITVLAALLIYWGVHYRLRQPDRLRDKLAEATRQLNEIAYTDPLTGLANRRMLFDRLQQLLDQTPDGSLHGLLYIDLDNFKRVNDQLGHEAGDQLLCHVANWMRTLIRQSDLAARIGGDEFCVLVTHIQKPEDAALIAENLLFALKEPLQGISDRYPVTASIGIVMIPEHGHDLKTLFRCADQAMYQAKNGGRNRYRFYQSIV